ncbi:EamA family transporter [Streptomyces zagrosensis]|uniref:Drug/metabolite transporter (DMT)-like permease n=1 Tax=Streptomyces zagrosensis TaxID=1042984 RepID=A0A7W9UYU1_9ACTN|nr:EamA family transporter [Streptomyces zagrosensis]MBB5936303.1 drug/metabolite transporter (DMT)-like permease [Streptomyces zagrosensis]
MGVFLALSSAACYGVVDFAGGLLSRRAHFAIVTFVGQVGGLALAVVLAVSVPAEHVGSADMLWGALSGLGSGLAMHFLNRGLSRGAMSIVIPISAVTGVALSVLCGVCLLGDRPTALAWLGMCVTVPALWLVSRGDRGDRGGKPDGGNGPGPLPDAGVEVGPAVSDGLVASAGVAVQYIGLAQAAPAAGLWPVPCGRVAAVAVLLPAAYRHREHFRQPVGLLAAAAVTGAGAAGGLALYLLAAQQQMLALAVVLASLYPAIPTLLGLSVLHERATRAQAIGLLSAAAATVLLTLG